MSDPPFAALSRRARADLHRTLVIPTLDEVDAVDDVATLAVDALDAGVVDRVVCVDGGSTDGTVAAARATGLEVLSAADRAPGTPVLGKGDSVWRIADLPTDVLVFRDADVVGVGVEGVAALAAAVDDTGVALAKGRFVRLQHRDGPARPVSGRITEFTARPLLGVLAPDLDLPEPLSGQFAVRSEVLANLPIVTRYGLDVGLVLDVVARFGSTAVTSVDLGSLTHRSKDDVSLVSMAHDVAATILAWTGPHEGGRPAWRPPGGTVALDPVVRALPCGGPDGPLVVRPPRTAWTRFRAGVAGAPADDRDPAPHVSTDPAPTRSPEIP